MPYITRDRRKVIDVVFPILYEKLSELKAGELNYLLTRMVDAWAKPLSYDKIDQVTGVLENVKQEFYRRVAAPYEDSKKRENGDVYA